jgi:SAM-dependent methyltransferase
MRAVTRPPVPDAPAGGAVARCRWCAAPLDGRADRLEGRTRCAACGVATTDPFPTPEELDAAYGDWYRPDAGRFSGPGDRLLSRTRARLAARVEKCAPPGPVLDVGAGDGSLVAALRATGREALGLERGARDIPHVVARAIEDVHDQQAAIVFWHSLEHLPEPAEALAHAAGLLKRGGLLVVAVPNAGSLQAQLFGNRWLALDLPRHLVHLTAPALVDRLRGLGLHVRRVSHVRGGQVLFGWLHGLVGLLPGNPDLYDAIRRPEARRTGLRGGARLLTLAAAVVLAPVAGAGSVVEVLLRRGGTVYVEAVR